MICGMLADVGKRLHVVDDRGLAEQALVGREWRLVLRLAAVALDGGDERRLLAADKRAGAEADVDVKVEPAVENILPQQPVFTRLPDGDFEALDRDGILRAHVDIAVMRADGVPRDGHGLQHRVRVALEHRAVHERARVALVGVADHILFIADVLGRKLPLEPGREACAAAAAKAGALHEVDDVRRGHFREHAAQRLIPVHADILLNVLRVDDAAVAQRHAQLRLVKPGV